jgi:DNA helicase-2/ATP-dependent DNA helicase PcrA
MKKVDTNSPFLVAYKRLNTAQKQAVDTIDGPVMVIAGPGTGKTSILTLRIANILQKTDTSAENILALTFTESGAYAMRKKLVEIIGTDGYKVNINTFHGFCNEVIKQYPERFPRIIGSIAITDIDQIALMENIIESEEIGSKLEYLKPYGDTFFYVKPVLGEIRALKREAISVVDFAKNIKKQESDFENVPEKIHIKGAHKGKMKGEFIKLKEKIEKNKELLKLYEAYEKALEKEKFYDFEDMIIEVIRTLKKDADLLLILQESYQYILADEHQDTNNAQNAVLELLSNFHKNPNLFIVGDDKQAIFRFQGASLDNFLYFQKLYPDAVLIHLEENYRSTQPILDASHSLILNNTIPKDLGQRYQRTKLIAKVEKGKEPIHVYETPNHDSECAFIINDIKNKIKNGVKAEEIAILYRDNKDAFPIAHALEKTDIPFRIESDNDILKDENIIKLLTIFEAINDLSNEEKLAKVLFVDFLNLNILDIYKTFGRMREEKRKLIDILTENFKEISIKLSRWASLSHNKTFIEVFETIVRESGYLEFALGSPDSIERMATLEAFFGELRKMAGARKQYSLKDFIEHLERVREHGILTKTGKGVFNSGIRLMTAHKSKGLEFDYVYIIGAYDGHWGNKTRREYFNTNIGGNAHLDTSIDDERRLFYVALTRARKEVMITYAKEGNQGRELLPTQFVSEISDEFKKVGLSNQTFDTATHYRESIAHKNHEIRNKEYLQELFLEQGLSVTSLNNYLKCPLEYFFVNLIRIPKAQSKHQMYGTAIHETLRTFFNKYREGEDMSKKDLTELFEFNLNRTLLSPLDFVDSLKKGKKALEGYFEAYKGTWNRNLLTEYSIRGVHLKVDGKNTEKGGENITGFDLLLKGNLDKIEMLNEMEVNIVDYKTGKRKSDNKDNYKRQLVFYKLLLSLDEKKRYTMKSGELDFIEPDDKGKYKKDVFEISDGEVTDLIKLIKEKAVEIYSLNFFDKGCNKKDCEYCSLSNALISK